ncbi:myc box-dependent-interacting protein 1-like [Apostichopus japonicus]|uniref:myc box-dependent-interacting protein 1-like n=1 Tax=Stichopus japonicus TaxID=307972 RepID=UPI003AB38D2F
MADKSDSPWGRKSLVFQKQFTRSKEKVLQKLGKSDETRDEIFECYTQNLTTQIANASKLNKEVKNYQACCRAMGNASSSLYNTLEEIYEEEWDGQSELGNIKETLGLLWDDYQRKLLDQIFNPIIRYQSKFPDMKKKVEKRGRKLIDYDSARHTLDGAKGKKDEARLAKAEEIHAEKKKNYEDINNDLHEELPDLYDRRIPFYAQTFQQLYSAESTFHEEVGKAMSQLSDIMANLNKEAQVGTYSIKKKIPTIHRDNNASHSSSLPVPPSPNSSDRSMASSEQPERGGSEQGQEEDEDEDDSQDAAEYQIPRSTPVVAPRLSLAENSEADEVKEEPKTTDLPEGVLYMVKALHDYACLDSDELSFLKGETIQVIAFDDPEDQDDGWLYGIKESDNTRGVFPENFTIRI